VQSGIRLRLRVFLGNVSAKIDVRVQCLPKRRIIGQTRLVGRLHVEGHEPVPLLIRDLEVAVHVDDVLKAKLAREAVGPAEGLRCEPGQMFDMMGLPFREQDLQYGIRENLGVEQFLKAVQCILSARVLVPVSNSGPATWRAIAADEVPASESRFSMSR
jgi:hypothetical protein